MLSSNFWKSHPIVVKNRIKHSSKHKSDTQCILLNERTNNLICICVILERLNLVVAINGDIKDFLGERKQEKKKANNQTKTTRGIKVPGHGSGASSLEPK